jgi:hypothetical protein
MNPLLTTILDLIFPYPDFPTQLTLITHVATVFLTTTTTITTIPMTIIHFITTATKLNWKATIPLPIFN